MASGTVKFFNAAKGFGFISPDIGVGDIFVHASAFQATGAQSLIEGQRVTYDTESDAKGLKVTKLELVSDDGQSHGAARPTPLSAADGGLELTIYHNPNCTTSQNVLSELQAAGHQPRIVEYLKTPFTKDALKAIAAQTKATIRDLARKTEPLFGELHLDKEGVSEDELLDAMIKHPVLINRPIVATRDAACLCRPSRMVKQFLADVSRH